MPQFDSFASDSFDQLPPAILQAIVQADLPSLGEGPHDSELTQLLQDPSDQAWSTLKPRQRDLCLSGLWLLAGDLDRSHTLSQSIDTADGSFWHGIMHRREGDFGNSKYWFRRVGAHPVLDQLDELTDGIYDDPYNFVDACSRAVKSGKATEDCVSAQWTEWQALMVHCVGSL